MTVVVKLGGVNGSGKTSVARALMEHVGGAKKGALIMPDGRSLPYYSAPYSNAEVYVLGKYETACGGMDTISDKHDRIAMVETVAKKKNAIVFFEGLITGKTYGAFGEMSEDHHRKGKPWLYAFMDTPFDECVRRVLQRRAAAGNHADFDPERTMRPTFNSCTRLEQKLRSGLLPEDADWQHHVTSLDHARKPHTLAKRLMDRALELHHGRVR